MTTSTIFALSSGAGRAGVSVIRVSGPATRLIIRTLTGGDLVPRQTHLRALHAQQDSTEIDRGLVIFFPSPNSFTGEDVAEFQVHGSPAVIRRLLSELGNFGNTQLAGPGAFTERAFINGKLDLTEVEGLSDLIAADTELQRTQALGQSSGILRERCGEWRRILIHALALIEAVLDFSDEGDVTEGPISEAQNSIEELVSALEAARADTSRAETIRNGLQVAIVGAPNAGKSSLLNTLAARDVAIVTSEPGTTRDTIEVQLELAGLPVTVIDTAGIRETNDKIEREGIERARSAARSADLVLQIIDATNPNLLNVDAPETWVIRNKIDLLSNDEKSDSVDLEISAKSGRGIDDLQQKLSTWCEKKVETREPAIVTRARQAECIDRCLSSLRQFSAADLAHLELRAEDLRTAATALGQLTGEIDAEDILDDIFSGFCIGK